MLAGLVVSKGTRRGGSRTVQMGKKSTAGSGKALGKTTQEVANNGKSVIEAYGIKITLLYTFRFDGYISR